MFDEPLVGKLFSHFDKKIRNIIQEVFHTARDEILLWRVAEKCYKEAARPAGTLRADGHFTPREATRPGLSYNDF
jgi:hypothetical protein